MKLTYSAKTVERTKTAMAAASHLCLSYVFGNESAITKLHCSAVLADCFEGFGAIIGVVVISYLAFERPLDIPFLGRRFWPHYLVALLLLILTAMAANLAQSNGQLYALRLTIGTVKSCVVLAAIIRVMHTGG